NVIHVANGVNPAADIEVINTELALADLEAVDKAINRYAKSAKGGDKHAVAIKALLEKIQPHLNEAKPLRSFGLDKEETALL
ncbi:redox-regulated ATPase YchF, partial [Pseudoxanthomonas sp. KAs_5_3]